MGLSNIDKNAEAGSVSKPSFVDKLGQYLKERYPIAGGAVSSVMPHTPEANAQPLEKYPVQNYDAPAPELHKPGAGLATILKFFA